MSVSLTKEEFLERFAKRNKLFQVAVMHDLENVSGQIGEQVKIQRDQNDIRIDLSQLFGTLVRNTLLRAVDLVYQDMTD